MGYNEIKCQFCGEVLNENSMFGWVKGDKFNPVNIYEVLKDIRNPLNLKCSILYLEYQSSTCGSGKLLEVSRNKKGNRRIYKKSNLRSFSLWANEFKRKNEGEKLLSIAMCHD